MLCKIVKKGLVGVALGGAALGILSRTPAWKYMKAASNEACATIQDSVPIELEIRTVRQEIADLDPEIIKGIEAQVKQEQKIEKLQAEIASTTVDMTREARELQALNDHLKTGDTHLTGGVAYSTKVVKTDLVRRMDHYKQVKETLAKKQETLSIEQRNVAATKERLETMKATKLELVAQVDEIEADLNRIRATSEKSEFPANDTAIGRVKNSVANLKAKVKQKARVDELKAGYFQRGVTVTVDPSRDICTEVDAEFGPSSKAGEKSAQDKL